MAIFIFRKWEWEEDFEVIKAVLLVIIAKEKISSYIHFYHSLYLY